MGLNRFLLEVFKKLKRDGRVSGIVDVRPGRNVKGQMDLSEQKMRNEKSGPSSETNINRLKGLFIYLFIYLFF